MGYEIKTKATKLRPLEYIQKIDHIQRKKDSLFLLDNFSRITKEKPVLWASGLGDGIIGYGNYSYVSKSGCCGNWMKTGFAPRKTNLVLYIMTGCSKYKDLLEKLGKYKIGVSCLYINKLNDINLESLNKIITKDYKLMCKKFSKENKIYGSSI